MEWVASTLMPPPNVVYPALLKLMRTPRLPAVDWTDAPTVSGKDEIWFLRVCHHVPHELYSEFLLSLSWAPQLSRNLTADRGRLLVPRHYCTRCRDCRPCTLSGILINTLRSEQEWYRCCEQNTLSVKPHFFIKFFPVFRFPNGPGYRRWTVRGSNHGWGEIFRIRPDRPWGAPSLLCNGSRVVTGGKAAGAWRWAPTLI